MGDIIDNGEHQLDLYKARAVELQRFSYDARTWKAYKRYWEKFSSYLGTRDPWKAMPEDVAGFCAKLAADGYLPRTIGLILCALSCYYHRLGKGFEHGQMGRGTRSDNPVRSSIVRSTMRGIWAHYNRPVQRSAALNLEQLERIIDL
jgi:hypothetical protein